MVSASLPTASWFSFAPRAAGVAARMARCARRGLAATVVVAGGALTGAPAPANADTKPWAFLYGDRELFPSMLVSLTDDSPVLPRDPAQLGDTSGVIAARVRASRPDTRVTVTLAATSLFAESSVTVVLPDTAEHLVAPTIRWDQERLARLRQPLANFVIKIAVHLDGEPPRDHYVKTVVHSVNDWLRAYMLRGRGPMLNDTIQLAAAYVNENNPAIERTITFTAQQSKSVLFTGYRATAAGKPSQVSAAQLEAIYNALRTLGLRYTALSQPSYVAEADPKKARLYAQNVRLMGDALGAKQANSFETATLLAATYMKLGLQVVLILFPNRDKSYHYTLVGVYEQPDTWRTDFNVLPLVIDPSSVSEMSYAEALKSGRALLEANKGRLVPLPPERAARRDGDRVDGYFWINLNDARMQGVLPIPEP